MSFLGQMWSQAGVQLTPQSSLASGVRQAGRENTSVRDLSQRAAEGHYWEIADTIDSTVSITALKSYLELIFVSIYNP